MTEEIHYNPTSAYFWLPRLLRGSIPFPIPKTEMVDCDFWDALTVLDSKKRDKIPWGKLELAVEKVGGPPAFIKSDVASAKHDGPKGYLVRKKSDLKSVICATVDHNACCDLEFAGFMVRQFIPLEHRFCAFRGHPIAREYRFFTKNGRVCCRHFYWPKAAIADSINSLPKMPGIKWDWEKDYEHIARPLSDGEYEYMEVATERVVRQMGPYKDWSVDWACDMNGDWWLIDMAIAQRSWHPHGCPEYPPVGNG